MKEHVYLVYLYVPGTVASASSTCTHQVKPLATRPLAFLRSRFSSAKITCFCPLQQMRVSSTIHQKPLILGPLELWIFSLFSAGKPHFMAVYLGGNVGKKQSTSEFYANLKVLNFLEPKPRCPNEILKMTNLFIPLNTALQNNVHAYHPIIHQYWGFPVSCIFGHIQTAMQMTRSYNFRIPQQQYVPNSYVCTCSLIEISVYHYTTMLLNKLIKTQKLNQ